MIGINSLSLNDDFNSFKELQKYFDFFECSKRFYLNNIERFEEIEIPCSCLSSLIIGNYDIDNKYESNLFIREFIDSCEIAKELDCKKMMFGLLRYRKTMSERKRNIFKELIQIAKSYDIDLLYEAISEKCGNKFLTTHKELIEFSKENEVSSIHVDYNTLRLNNEKISDIEYPISNIHYPLGIEVCLEMDVSLENYDNLNINEIKEWVKKWN